MSATAGTVFDWTRTPLAVWLAAVWLLTSQTYACPRSACGGYPHTKTILSASGDPAHVAMPAVHRVASLLERRLLGGG